MIRNTAGQKTGVQMIAAADGTAFTGAVTVAVTVDAGTQATGSVGAGACAHEGGGYHTYAPAQAETDGDLVAFTYSGSGAVPQTVQIYTRASVPNVNVLQISGDSTAADNLEAAADGTGYNLGGGSVVAASVTGAVIAVTSRLSTLVTKTATVVTDGGNSATAFKTSLTETATDHYKDCLVKITSGVLAEQIKKVTAYNGTTKVLTVSGGFTGTPADAVTLEIVNE